MQLKQLTITKAAIKFTADYNPDSDDDFVAEEERKSICKEAPLPELTEAFEALKPVVCEIMALPKKYTSGMAVVQITISYTKNGTRAVALGFKKALDTIGGQLHAMDTPFVKVDAPGDGESGTVQVSAESAELIETALMECERYANGERAQKALDLETAGAGLNALAEKGRKDQPELAIP